MDRRRFLTLGAAGVGVFAGCPGQSDIHSESPSPTATSTNKETGATNNASNKPDTAGPEFQEFRVRPAPERGRVQYNLVATDDHGIVKANITSQQDESVAEFDTKHQIDISGTVQASPGDINSVEATIFDQDGNQATKRDSSYTRLHAELTEETWNIGCTYTLGGGNWQCKAGEPAVGRYDQATQQATRHLDQLAGHGTSRLLIEFQSDQRDRPEQQLVDSSLADDFRIQYQFDLVESLQDGRLKTDLDQLQQRIKSIGPSHRATEDGHPIVTLQSIYAFGGEDDQAKRLEETVTAEFGGFDTLMDEIKTRLEIDGKRPYLVAQTGMLLNIPRGSAAFLSWLTSFDAITHALWLHETGPEYQAAMQEIQTIYRSHWLWARDHDMEFIPVVVPGYDNRANDCWETEQTHIEREPEAFGNALAIAAEYATVKRLSVVSFNNWYDGTQIEPGTTDDTAYGTEYLKQVGKLQRTGIQVEEDSTHYVGPDGIDSNPGTADSPLRTIGHAFFRAQPGDTIEAKPGRYHEVAHTIRPGTPDNPITLTGPSDAVFIGGNMTSNPEPLEIMHSHVHVTGLTFDGLQYPNRSDELSSYAKANVSVDPINRTAKGEKPPYVSDVVISPHAVGNTLGNCIHIFFGDDIEVGGFRHIGPSGVAHFVFDEPGHDGEIVYIGTSADGWEGRWGGHVDRTKNVHVHHIDASAGYAHSEIADAKPGTENVLVEYCTSVGAVSDPNTGGGTGLHLGGVNGTARCNIINKSSPTGILIGNWRETYEAVPAAGTENSVYKNEVSGTYEEYTEVTSTVKSITLTDEVSISDQVHYCGNEFEQPADGNPEKACPDEVPTCDGIGHTGGNSPWR